MRHLVRSSVGSFSGMLDAEGNRECLLQPRSWKYEVFGNELPIKRSGVKGLYGKDRDELGYT